MDDFKIESVVNTYNNAILLRKFLVVDYMKMKISTSELISSIHTCEVLIIANSLILKKHGLDKSR